MKYKFKGTQGNWAIETLFGGDICIGKNKPDNSTMEDIVVCLEYEAECTDEYEDKKIANAHLIAAAPDLLNACIEVEQSLDELEDYLNHDFATQINTLKSAIHKALNVQS